MTTNPVPHAWVADLFRRLAAVYGVTALEARYPARTMPQTMHAWSEALAGFPPAAVQRAAESLAKDGPGYPPSLPEFVAAVQKAVPRERARPALPPPQRTPEQLERGRAHLAAIRAIAGHRPARAPLLRGKPVQAREPGEDDEPAPPRTTPACTCWTGLKRAETLCPACSEFVRLRLRQRALGEEMGGAKR